MPSIANPKGNIGTILKNLFWDPNETGYPGDAFKGKIKSDFLDVSNITVAEVDPTVNSLGKATLGCTANQVPQWNGSAWICTDYTSGIATELDPVWSSASGNYYTKTNLQTF
jgi:hypothetical protein